MPTKYSFHFEYSTQPEPPLAAEFAVIYFTILGTVSQEFPLQISASSTPAGVVPSYTSLSFL